MSNNELQADLHRYFAPSGMQALEKEKAGIERSYRTLVDRFKPQYDRMRVRLLGCWRSCICSLCFYCFFCLLFPPYLLLFLHRVSSRTKRVKPCNRKSRCFYHPRRGVILIIQIGRSLQLTLMRSGVTFCLQRYHPCMFRSRF